VCLSAAAHEYVHKLLPLAFEDLGPQAVKNLDAPIRAYFVHPSGAARSPALPAVHRRIDFHLARRFHSICVGVVEDITVPEGLMPTDPPILAALADSPGIGEHQIAERIGIASSKLRRMLKRLESQGLVARNQAPNGRGQSTFALTPDGIETQRRMYHAVLAAQDRVMAPLSDTERETLRNLLARIIKADAASRGDTDYRGAGPISPV
jgi:DNA-binding MarR family transcriptional regulator